MEFSSINEIMMSLMETLRHFSEIKSWVKKVLTRPYDKVKKRYQWKNNEIWFIEHKKRLPSLRICPRGMATTLLLLQNKNYKNLLPFSKITSWGVLNIFCQSLLLELHSFLTFFINTYFFHLLSLSDKSKYLLELALSGTRLQK